MRVCGRTRTLRVRMGKRSVESLTFVLRAQLACDGLNQTPTGDFYGQ
jgi:hypothetical protein